MSTLSFETLEILTAQRVANRNFIDRDIQNDDDIFFGSLQLTSDYAIDIDGSEMVYSFCGDTLANVSEDLSLKILDMLIKEESEEKANEEFARDCRETENYLCRASRSW